MNHIDLHSDATVSALFEPWATAKCWLLGYSGGMDSSVLLHLCVRAQRLLHDAQRPAPQLQAIHVDHRLSPNHADWATFCAEQCRALAVPLLVKSSEVSRQGEGLEAAAREARYSIFLSLVERQDDVLMLGHHEDDQGETLLFRLMRGCGVHGAAAIPSQRALDRGLLARPLLKLPRELIQSYANSCGINYIEDESNVDLRFDRNFLRQEVLPLLRQRWPSANRTLARFAGLAKEQQQLATDLARVDFIAAVTEDERFGQCLSIKQIVELPAHRRNNLYHFLLSSLGLDISGRIQITEIDAFVRSANAGKLLEAGRCSLRIHQGNLFFIDSDEVLNLPRIRQPLAWQFEPFGHEVPGEIKILGALVEPGSPPATRTAAKPYNASNSSTAGNPSTAGNLSTIDGSSNEDQHIRRQAYRLGQRLPNAVARVNGNGKPLKKLLQELGIPAWLRDFIPVLYANFDKVPKNSIYDVAAIPGYLVCDDYKDSAGPALQWRCTMGNALESAGIT